MDSTAATPAAVEAGVVAADLACAHCGYNLRTQQKDGLCPECGKPVRDSLANPLSLADPNRIAQVRLGVWFLVIGLAGAVMISLDQTIAILRGGMWWLSTHQFQLQDTVIIAAGGLLLTCIRPRWLRRTLLAAYIVPAGWILHGQHLLYVTSYLWDLLGENVTICCKIVGCALIARPLPHTDSRWSVALWISVLLIVLSVSFQDVDSIQHAIPITLLATQMLICLYLRAVAQQCQWNRLAKAGVWLTRVMLVAYPLVIGLLLYLVITKPNLAILPQFSNEWISLHLLTIMTAGVDLLLWVFLVVFAWQFKLPASSRA